MKHVWAAGFSAGLLLLFAGKLVAQSPLSGKVLDAATHRAVAGAVVRVEDSFLSTVTDSAGAFTFSKTGKSQVVLEVSHLSYQAQQLPVKLPTPSLEILLIPRIVTAEEVTVTALRATPHSAIATTITSKEELSRRNLGPDIPFLLDNTPSAVSTSDAGAGVGYTALRVRGSDATRTNVTINGIPVNDAESQAVYWVDLPDLAASSENIEVQRGLGTSTNGAGAFGASVNIQSLRPSATASGTVSSSAGSFGTTKNSFGFGTGPLGKFSFDGRFSLIKSDGFIDRSASDLKSTWLGASYTGKKSSLRFLLFTGREKTGQAWYGVPEAKLRNDQAALLTHYYNNVGVLYFTPEDSVNLFHSNPRTYNYYTYADQTDNYGQDNYQLHYALNLSDCWTVNAALHYTHGSGYYEEFQHNQNLADYGVPPGVFGSDTVFTTDLVRRRWLQNDFYGIVYSLQFRKKNLSAVFGGAWNRYEGDHYGEVTWAAVAVTVPKDYEYYRNNADKKDFNSYLKLGWDLSDRLHLMADMQYRRVDYSFTGFDNAMQSSPQHVLLNFFNPKAGVQYDLPSGQSIYGYAGLGHKEPMRDDYTDAPSNSRPGPESLFDLEAGYRIRADRFMASANLFNMMYTDQLVVTGYINDIGLYPRQNVPDSYRRGVEIEGAWQALPVLKVEANVTLSHNKIKEYHAYTPLYDINGAYIGQETATYKNTDLAFSPEVTGSGILTWTPVNKLALSVAGKYIGRQFLDNTSSASRQLDPYGVFDFRANYSLTGIIGRSVDFSVGVFNLLNAEYESNGYTYSYKYAGNPITENYYFPQAGRNFLAGITLNF